ncbi:ATP-binding protein, partial [uncultured Nostoc sp.]|uniref:ATP-binding protein n=1 Tax=uncultured Nostoc sp. TaxID=340711 RepID=UPI0035CA285C
HLGDEATWSQSDFDDTRWDSLNPTQNTATLTKLPQQGIGWLRLRLQIAPPMRGKLVGLLIRQKGAFDLFLNGKFIAQAGQISSQKQIALGVEKANLPYISLGTDSVQLLAIRYAFSNQQWPLIKRRDSFFEIRVVATELAQADSVNQLSRSTWDTLLFGIFLALGTLQLLLYLASTQQRATLNLGLFLVTQGVTHFIATDSLIVLTSVTQVGLASDLLNVLFTIALTVSGYCYLIGIYQYFRQPKRFLFYGTAVLTLATIPICLFFPFYEGLSWFILAILVPWLEVLRVGLSALNQKKPGAKLFTIAHGLLVVVYIIYTLAVFIPSFNSFLGNSGGNLFFICFLGLALTVSLLLSYERAVTNELLRRQLIEVETLSQKNILQEQEKQQLLASQNERLEQQVEARTVELKASQAQLIQKEKLASLGELTAGIAHEIQNPLNFVNNFSEVSTELIDELKEGPFQQLPESEKDYAEEILSDLTQNLQKITQHGGRASSIVKGMLEHSRPTSGERQLTNLNALADEYLHLAYQGQRAKDKSFTCELVTQFDASLGEVNLVAQEIGRVLLNLYNNAFYAVRERSKQPNPDYKPTVTVTTQRTEQGVQLRVADNGTGIAEGVQQKVFQPFFTTKPTGEGTGLGLSLSYDIITKGHNGTLRVESQVNEGTSFFIELPQGQKTDLHG